MNWFEQEYPDPKARISMPPTGGWLHDQDIVLKMSEVDNFFCNETGINMAVAQLIHTGWWRKEGESPMCESHTFWIYKYEGRFLVIFRCNCFTGNAGESKDYYHQYLSQIDVRYALTQFKKHV